MIAIYSHSYKVHAVDRMSQSFFSFLAPPLSMKSLPLIEANHTSVHISRVQSKLQFNDLNLPITMHILVLKLPHEALLQAMRGVMSPGVDKLTIKITSPKLLVPTPLHN